MEFPVLKDDNQQLLPLLDGYSHTEWPDLSADRSPLNITQTTSTETPLFKRNHDEAVVVSAILSVVARVIGAYCGTSDVLLAIQVGRNESICVIRILWHEDQSWENLMSKVQISVQSTRTNPISLSSVKKTFTLKNNQYPCMALCRFDLDSKYSAVEYPAIFSYDRSTSLLQLSASTKILHPTVSTQIASQICDLVQWSHHHPTSKATLTPTLRSHLMSICERGTEEAVSSAYPHIFPVSFAPDYLAQRAKDMPFQTAVRWYPELSLDAQKHHFDCLSYLDLHRKANQVARWLLRHGLQPEDRVAVCLDRNLEFHTAMMGIMRAGGCYVPIDPELPLERKIYIAKDANATLVLTSSQIASRDVFGPVTCYFEEKIIQSEISQEGTTDLSKMKPTGLAYLLYTSGTTGNPKGCLLTHHGLAQAILALSNTAADVRMANIHEGRYLAVASIAFDVHLAETMVPFALGMALLSARRSQLLENLPIYINQLGITHLGIVPSLIEATLNAAQGETNGSQMALRYIASGGEKMSDSILDKWANHSQVRLANFYGPSEVTIGCCARYMTSATPRANIGRALANVSAYVVDTNMNILMRGGVGELVVEGPLVGRGYHGRDDLTTKVFVEWPEKGCWAYRTGDLVRMMPDSTLEIVGRIDTQIKLRGVRIESEGISAIIRNAVSSSILSLDVTTILSKHPSINVDQLVSLFAWDKTIPIATRKSKKPYISIPPAGLLKQIKAKCEAELPSYMRPSHFIPLSWLPLSSNGKIDEKSLAQLFRDQEVEVLAKIFTEEDARNSRLCTALEFRIFEILQKHMPLPLNNPRPDLNVFECGLDSMAVIRFSADLNSGLKARISPSEIMKNPCLSSVASCIQLAEVSACDTQIPSRDVVNLSLLQDLDSSFEQSQVEEVLPPFMVQEGVLARSADIKTLYVQHVFISCNSTVSVSDLQRTWKIIVGRHQILRTVFHFGRTLAQVVLHPDACELQWVDKAFPSDETSFRQFFMKEEASEMAKAINQDLSRTPPYRLSSYSLSSHTLLVLSIHHALFDGISLPRLLWEVESEYLGMSSGPPPSMPSDILKQISTINLDEAREFWLNYFKNFWWPRPFFDPVQPATIQHHSISFRSSLSTCRALAASQKVTLQALLTGAFAHIIARHIYKSRDVVFGVLRSGRLLPIDGVETALCPLVTIVPTRVNFKTPQNALKDIQEGIASVVDYEHVPLGKVQSWIRPGSHLFEMLFSISVNDPPESEIWNVVQSEPPQADYALAVEVVLNPTEDSVLVQAAWKDEHRSQIYHEVLHELEEVAHRLAEDPSAYIIQSLSSIPHPSPHYGSETKPALADASLEPDPRLISTLRATVANFLQVNPSILTPSLSFVSVGLDSIKSVGLARIISKQGFKITSTELLRNSTLTTLAICIESKSRMENGRNEVSDRKTADLNQDILSEVIGQQIELSDDDRITLFPTTALQAGMLSQTVASLGKLYVHPFPLRISGELDVQRLRNAWKTAVRTFSVLRTTFHFSANSGTWVQATHVAETLDWAEIHIRTEAEYSVALQGFLKTIILSDETSFRLPPLWVRLFKPLTGKATLVFVMHHALYDGISIDLLVRALDAFHEGIPYQPEKQFFDLLPYFIAQEKEGTSFWITKLSSFHPKFLGRTGTSSAIASVALERDIELESSRVKEILSEAAVTMQCICQAAWARLMTTYTGSADVVFGRTVSGRSLPGAENVIGPILNTIPCCIKVQEGLQNIEFLRSIHQGNLDALHWQQASPRAIQKALGVDKLWDSLFLFQSLRSGSSRDDRTIFESTWTDNEESGKQDIYIQYPLNVEMTHRDSGIAVKLASQTDFFDKNDLNILADHLRDFILEIVRDPNGVISNLLDTISRPSLPSHGIVGEAPQISQANGNSTVSLVDPSVYQPVLLSLNVPISLLGPDTPLIALGIDSITAIQIVSKFRQVGLKTTASDILNSRTMGEMLGKITPIESSTTNIEERPSTVSTETEKLAVYEHLKIAPRNIEEITIATSGMKWLIGAWQKSQKTRFQHVFPFQLPQGVDFTRIRASWFSLVQRHAILRSTFACPIGVQEPLIVTFKAANKKSWSEECVPEDSFYRSILSRMRSLVECPPPTNEAQARAVLFYSRSHHYLILHLHHFQYDAWSLQLLVRELSGLYTDTGVTISNKMRSFLSHYAPNSSQLAEQQRYWTNSFPADFEPTYFPILNPDVCSIRPIERLIRTNMACIQNASRLEEAARSQGVSLQSVFLACWARIQGQICTSSSSTFGLWHSGRTGTLDDISNLAIPCMNVLPIYIAQIQEEDIIAIAGRIQADLRLRTSVVEQSDLVRVNEWVGARKAAICNVFLNIVKVALDIDDSNVVLKLAYAPYFIPSQVRSLEDPVNESSVSRLIKDDLFVDIAIVSKTDGVMMSIDTAAYMMTEGQADALILRWAGDVEEALGLNI